jgi:hypothetical protein
VLAVASCSIDTLARADCQRTLQSGWDEECPQRRVRDAQDVSNAVQVFGKKNLARPKVANLASAGLDLQYAGQDHDELAARWRVRLGVSHLGRHDKDDGLDGYGVREKQRRNAGNDERGLRDEDEPALQKLGDEGWEIVQIVPRQETNWVLVVFSRPRGTPGEVVT